MKMSVSNEHDQSEIQFQNTDQKVKKKIQKLLLAIKQ